MKPIRRLLVLLLCLAAASAAAAAPPAAASGTQTPTTAPGSTATTMPGATAIGDGFVFTGAAISSSAEPVPRSLNGYQTAVFVQSWLPFAFFGKPEFRDPPAELPVYRVDIAGTWGTGGTGNQTVYFATDGTEAFMSYPQLQEVTPTPPASPPAPTRWFIAPQRTIGAFNGTETLVETAGVVEANSPKTTPRPADSGSGSGSSNSWLTYVLVAAIAVVVLGGGMMLYRRRSSGRAASA